MHLSVTVVQREHKGRVHYWTSRSETRGRVPRGSFFLHRCAVAGYG